MGKFKLRQCVHAFNMAWRKLVSSKWRLRVTEEKPGVYALWNQKGRIFVGWDAESVANTLLLLNRIWERELPA